MSATPTFTFYDSYYYDNGEPSHLSHPSLDDCPDDAQLEQDVPHFQSADGTDDMFGIAWDINSDVLYESMTRSPLSSGLMQPPSARGSSPSYSSPDRVVSVPESYDAVSNGLSPLWHRSDDPLPIRSSFFRPVLPDSDVQATVSPAAIFMPPSGSDSDSGCADPDFDSPSPPPYGSRPSRPSSPFPSPPLIASSLRLSQPPMTASAPLKEQPPTGTATRFSKRQATENVKGQDAIVGIFPQSLTAKLGANPVHRDKVISKAIERQGGRYWFVTFTDGSKCCVCNLPDTPCNRVCSNSRGINRHFRAAPHFLGQRLDCNHPTHPCGASFLRQDVLTRHLATPHSVERHKGEMGDDPRMAKDSTVTRKSSRVARGKPY